MTWLIWTSSRSHTGHPTAHCAWSQHSPTTGSPIRFPVPSISPFHADAGLASLARLSSGTTSPATLSTSAGTHFPLGAGKRIGIYDAERSIVDSFRLRHSEGSDLAVEALRAWLRRPDSRPAALLHMARAFPPAYPALRSALEVLL